MDEATKGEGEMPAPPEGTPPVLTLGKDEMNLAEFPFAILAKRAGPEKKTIEVVQEGRDEAGRPVRQEWIVTGSDKFGLPVAADDEVYVALMKLLRDSHFKDRTVRFTVARLLRTMRSSTSKRDYERIAAALDRLTGVTLRSKNAFWDHARRRYVTEAFHLLDSYRLATGGSGRDLSEATFSEFLFGSIRAGYVKNLDVDFYFSLPTPLARRLYRLLDKHRYRGRLYESELTRLAQKLPLQDPYESQLRRRLDPVFEELVRRGFLTAAEYRKGTGGATIVRIVFAPAGSVLAEPAPAAPPPDAPALSLFDPPADAAAPAQEDAAASPDGALGERLRAAGVSRAVAADLARRFPAEEIARQLDYLPHVEGLKNPGGYLRLAIEHGYAPPPGWTAAQNEAVRRAGREPIVPSVPDPVEAAWKALGETKRAELLGRAEAALRQESAAFRGMRRIPAPLVAAHARHLLAGELPLVSPTRPATPAAEA